MLKSTATLITLSLMLALANGCAVGVKHDYHSANPNFSASGSYGVAVAVHDQREHVAHGKHDPSWVGESRGGYGNPFGVKTLSGNPLAEDFATVVVRGLAARGFRAAAVTVAPTDTPEQVREQVLAEGKDRSILITLDRWNSDTYQAVRLVYSVRAEVLALDGTVLGSKDLDFKGGLGSGGMNPPKRSRKYIPRAYEQAVEDLLNADTIVKALESR